MATIHMVIIMLRVVLLPPQACMPQRPFCPKLPIAEVGGTDAIPPSPSSGRVVACNWRCLSHPAGRYC